MEKKAHNKIALLLYATLFIEEIILGLIYRLNPILLTNKMNVILLTSFFNICCLSISYLLNKKYQLNLHLSDIGFSKERLKKSILLGLGVSSIIFVWRVITGIISFPLTGIRVSDMIYIAIYQLIFIVIFEEIIFRAIIGKHFFIYNKTASIIIVGLLFASLHIPFQVITGQFTLYTQLSKTIVFVCLHAILQYLYNRYDSLAAPTLLHFAINYLSWLSGF